MTYRRLLEPLLFAYPREFRQHYREQLFVDVDDALRENGGEARGGSFLLRTACDVVATGLMMRLEIPARDIAFSLRTLVRAPLFSIVAIVTLALAIGVNGAVFAVIDAVLLKPLPFVQPDRLAFVSAGTGITWTVPPRLLDAYRRESNAFQLATYGLIMPTLTGYGIAKTLDGETVSWNLFDVMRVHPQLGRFFSADDARPGTHSVVISNHVWQRFFGRDRHVIGRVLRLDSTAWRVVGVTAPGFAMADYRREFAFGSAIDVFECTPASTFAAAEASFGGLYGLVRLRAGVSLAAARADLRRIDRSFERRHPGDKGLGVLLVSLPAALLGDVRPLLVAALGAVALVVLIACANLANLLLVRGAAREREFAVRSALGAQRSRLAAHVLTEAGLLALAGGIVGALLASLELNGLLALHLASIPRIETARIDGRVLLFLFGIVVFAALVAGLVPVLTMRTRNLNVILGAAGRGGDAAARTGLRSSLIVVEIALAFAVLVASVLLVRSALAVAGVKLGFSPHGVYAGQILIGDSYPTAAKQRSFASQTLAQLNALPGAAASSIALTVPGTNGAVDVERYVVVGAPAPGGNPPSVLFDRVSPGYFKTLTIPLLRGRLFTASDRFGARAVALVSAGFARAALGGSDPIGKLLLFPDASGKAAFTVVGVVGDTRLDPARAPRPAAYVPFDQLPEPVFAVLVRAYGAGAALVSDVPAALARVDPLQAVQPLEPLGASIAQETAPQRTNAWLIGILGLVALLLAVAGVYALSAYSVAQRTHEFGVRMAIGARGGDILRNVLGRSLRLAVLGVALGLVFAALGTQLLTNLLFGVSAFDPLTFAVVIVILLASATVASLVPALRATHVDPVVALRYE